MSNVTFDILKRIQRFMGSVNIFLATILALYSVPAQTVAIVVGTVDAVSVLFGAFLEVSTSQYKKTLDELKNVPYTLGVDKGEDNDKSN